jgi:hypothetical protein
MKISHKNSLLSTGLLSAALVGALVTLPAAADTNVSNAINTSMNSAVTMGSGAVVNGAINTGANVANITAATNAAQTAASSAASAPAAAAAAPAALSAVGGATVNNAIATGATSSVTAGADATLNSAINTGTNSVNTAVTNSLTNTLDQGSINNAVTNSVTTGVNSGVTLGDNATLTELGSINTGANSVNTTIGNTIDANVTGNTDLLGVDDGITAIDISGDVNNSISNTVLTGQNSGVTLGNGAVVDGTIQTGTNDVSTTVEHSFSGASTSADGPDGTTLTGSLNNSIANDIITMQNSAAVFGNDSTINGTVSTGANTMATNVDNTVDTSVGAFPGGEGDEATALLNGASGATINTTVLGLQNSGAVFGNGTVIGEGASIGTGTNTSNANVVNVIEGSVEGTGASSLNNTINSTVATAQNSGITFGDDVEIGTSLTTGSNTATSNVNNTINVSASLGGGGVSTLDDVPSGINNSITSNIETAQNSGVTFGDGALVNAGIVTGSNSTTNTIDNTVDGTLNIGGDGAGNVANTVNNAIITDQDSSLTFGDGTVINAGIVTGENDAVNSITNTLNGTVNGGNGSSVSNSATNAITSVQRSDIAFGNDAVINGALVTGNNEIANTIGSDLSATLNGDGSGGSVANSVANTVNSGQNSGITFGDGAVVNAGITTGNNSSTTTVNNTLTGALTGVPTEGEGEELVAAAAVLTGNIGSDISTTVNTGQVSGVAFGNNATIGSDILTGSNTANVTVGNVINNTAGLAEGTTGELSIATAENVATTVNTGLSSGASFGDAPTIGVIDEETGELVGGSVGSGNNNVDVDVTTDLTSEVGGSI